MTKLSFKKGTAAFKKRKKIAEGIAKKNPNMPMAKKFAIASSVVKKMKGMMK